MLKYFFNFLKGLAMGTANVIPGVSGGTIALITGVMERLVNAIKSFNMTSFKLFFSGKFKAFAEYVDLSFLLSLFVGILVAVFSLAKLFGFLFIKYPEYIWSFFFGLVLASIYYVGITVKRWSLSSIIFFIIGTAIACVISFGVPQSENANFLYLILCGIVASCSMILPGLSGSFVLLLMGNYELVVIKAITELDIAILVPFGLGAVIGLIGFSYILSWVFKRYRDQTISVLTGFILGSMPVIWPWKEAITRSFGEKEKVIGYKWLLPSVNEKFFISVFIIVLGVASIVLTEKLALKKENKS